VSCDGKSFVASSHSIMDVACYTNAAVCAWRCEDFEAAKHACGKVGCMGSYRRDPEVP
jgi:hypothetical protein